ncbi:hypothetical protein LTR56_021252 [Elasticomyces elasticus]|nr:hypothetical protein LTR56_021252 [Elasticomyces elasticus]KAK3663582.1 hypothetical protein LTR22_005522 [Elasticomyces elasticus]KAK4923550.1 hypothetical protein LTR49_009263 [Elasticomyces elasticus]KAK5751564.1 hypothetical protein LTS12_018337 [Elasticomyces elasticus]
MRVKRKRDARRDNEVTFMGETLGLPTRSKKAKKDVVGKLGKNDNANMGEETLTVEELLATQLVVMTKWGEVAITNGWIVCMNGTVELPDRFPAKFYVGYKYGVDNQGKPDLAYSVVGKPNRGEFNAQMPKSNTAAGQGSIGRSGHGLHWEPTFDDVVNKTTMGQDVRIKLMKDVSMALKTARPRPLI